MTDDTKAAKAGISSFDPAKVKVATKVHLTRETLELLRDVALARHISDIGAINKRERVKLKSPPNISDIISELVERARPNLEQELERTLGRKRG
jgi:hypothetical protein